MERDPNHDRFTTLPQKWEEIPINAKVEPLEIPCSFCLPVAH